MGIEKTADQLVYFLIFLLVIIMAGLMFGSSNREYLDKSDYYLLKRQLTPDNKYYIYQYARYGAAFTGDITGTRLIELNESFAESAGEPFPYEISGWLSKDTLLINSVDESGKDADTLPVGIKYESFRDYIVKRVNYKSTVRGGGRNEYTFDSLNVSEGKIKILGIDSTPASMTFLLGPITINCEGDSIKNIEVHTLSKYHNVEREAMIQYETYEFKPTRRIRPNTVGKIGVFFSLK